jgi:hypothetical protein
MYLGSTDASRCYRNNARHHLEIRYWRLCYQMRPSCSRLEAADHIGTVGSKYPQGGAMGFILGNGGSNINFSAAPGALVRHGYW